MQLGEFVYRTLDGQGVAGAILHQEEPEVSGLGISDIHSAVPRRHTFGSGLRECRHYSSVHQRARANRSRVPGTYLAKGPILREPLVILLLQVVVPCHTNKVLWVTYRDEVRRNTQMRVRIRMGAGMLHGQLKLPRLDHYMSASRGKCSLRARPPQGNLLVPKSSRLTSIVTLIPNPHPHRP